MKIVQPDNVPVMGHYRFYRYEDFPTVEKIARKTKQKIFRRKKK